MSNKGFLLLAAVLVSAIGVYATVVPYLAPSPAVQTAAGSCSVSGGSSVQTSDASKMANSKCPAVSWTVYYDPKRSCGAVLDQEQCTKDTASKTNKMETFNGKGTFACAKNKANCVCKGGNSQVVISGTCATENVCTAKATLSRDGQLCSYDTATCAASCRDAGSSGKEAFTSLENELGIKDTGGAVVVKTGATSGDKSSDTVPTTGGSEVTSNDHAPAPADLSTLPKTPAPQQPVSSEPLSPNNPVLTQEKTSTAQADIMSIMNGGQPAAQQAAQAPAATTPAAVNSQVTNPGSFAHVAPATAPASTPGAVSTPSAGPVAAATTRPGNLTTSFPSTNRYTPTFGSSVSTAVRAPTPSASIAGTYQTLQNSSAGAGSGFISFFSGLVSGLISTPTETINNIMAPSSAQSAPPTIYIQSTPQAQNTSAQTPALQYRSASAQTMQPVYIINYGSAPVGTVADTGSPLGAYDTTQGNQDENIVHDTSSLPPGVAKIFEEMGLSAAQVKPSVPASDRAATSSLAGKFTGPDYIAPATLGASGVDTASAISLLGPSWSVTGAGFKGGWSGGNSLLADQAGLAQAQSNLDYINAQIDALQKLDAAGLCDESCAQALAALQSGVTVTEERIKTLTKSVAEGQANAEAAAKLPAPSVQMASVVSKVVAQTRASSGIEQFANLAVHDQGAGVPAIEYDLAAPLSLAASSSTPAMMGISTTSVAAPTIVPVLAVPSSSVSGNAPLLLSNDTIVGKIVSGVVDFFKHLFLAPQSEQAATSTAPQQSCSLFRSLFGGCK